MCQDYFQRGEENPLTSVTMEMKTGRVITFVYKIDASKLKKNFKFPKTLKLRGEKIYHSI